MAGYFQRDLVGCDNERGVKMDVSLRDAARGVTKQPGNCQFRKAKFGSNAGEGVSKDMRRYRFEFCFCANPVKDAHDADEMALSPIGGKDKW